MAEGIKFGLTFGMQFTPQSISLLMAAGAIIYCMVKYTRARLGK